MSKILVSEAGVSIMMETDREPTEAIKLNLRALCLVLAGVEETDEWFLFAHLMQDVNTKLMVIHTLDP